MAHGPAMSGSALLDRVGAEAPVLIAGPTASGKSALALEIAERKGGCIVNADALQVYDAWPILTARPTAEEMVRAPHALFGHVPWRIAYSVGDWLRDVQPLLAGRARPIIVGGTGLYFAALTEGLAEIPPVPPETRAEADARLAEGGVGALLCGLDPETRARIDTANPARVQRAWEVLRATGRGLAAWQSETAPGLLPPDACVRLVMDAPRDWLTPRIEARFDAMLAGGALEEARAMAPVWDPRLPSSRAIGAAELVAHARGEMSLDAARGRAVIASRRYAKRQRTWARARMADWTGVFAPDAAPAG